MKDEKNKILVTAYIDNQLKSPEELRLFKKAMQEDPSLEFDLETELLTKKILKNKYSRKNLPDGKKDDLVAAILKENVKVARKKSFRENIYSRRFIAYSTAAVILIAFVLLLFNRPAGVSPYEISEQTGVNNMAVLASQNFKEYVNGNRTVQFISSSSESIKDYFNQSGVKYQTYIPKLEKYKLVGASVSEHNGVKLAHHFYSTDDGKYIYVFQVHQEYFRGDSIIRLTNDLMNYLNLGNHYKTSSQDYTMILKRQNDNFIALVSNAPAEEVTEEFFR